MWDMYLIVLFHVTIKFSGLLVITLMTNTLLNSAMYDQI